MTIKFNHDMYAKMRAKKNEPLSALGKRVVCIVDQGSLATPVATVTRPTRAATSATLVEGSSCGGQRERESLFVIVQCLGR